jgi:hemerythrin-like domain-containing protein
MSPQQTLDLIDDILTTHHARLKAELPVLGEALPEDIAVVFSELRLLLEGHLMKEETILFPNIQGLARGLPVDGCGLIGPIRQMRHEHTRIRALEERLRDAAQRGGPGTDALLSLLDDLAIHAEKEDTRLFPAAFALTDLPEPDWAALDVEDAAAAPAKPRVVTPTPAPAAERPSLLRRIARRLRS